MSISQGPPAPSKKWAGAYPDLSQKKTGAKNCYFLDNFHKKLPEKGIYRIFSQKKFVKTKKRRFYLN